MAKAPVKKEGFTFAKRSKESLKERANMKGGNFDSYIKPKYKQWKPKDGKNIIRILPPTWDKADAPWQATAHYGLDIYVNFSIGADNQAYLSLSKHGKGADPLAEARQEAQREGDKDLAKALNANQRILYWIIDRNDEDEGPLLWAAPFTFDKSLSNLCIDVDTKEVFYVDGNDDPDKGRDVRFYKEGSGLTTKYDPSKMKVLGETPVCEDLDLADDWLAFITDNPLTETLNFYDYDHIKNTFDGMAGRKDEDTDEEKPRARRAEKVVAEDDEPEEKPRSRKVVEDDEPVRPRRRAVVENEDDVDESPARGRTASASGGKNSVRSRSNDEDDDPEPVRTPTRRRVVEEAEEEESPPPKSRRGKTEEPDEEEEGGGTLRERLARRRSRA